VACVCVLQMNLLSDVLKFWQEYGLEAKASRILLALGSGAIAHLAYKFSRAFAHIMRAVCSLPDPAQL